MKDAALKQHNKQLRKNFGHICIEIIWTNVAISPTAIIRHPMEW